MYAKIFYQIFSSSIVEKPEVRFTFMDLLVLADQNGVVDMTRESIARQTNRPLELICATIAELEGSDEQSRTPDFNGVRIKRLDDHRDWGWFIVNYERFRSIANGEQRRERTKERTRKWREKNKHGDAPVTPCDACDAKQKQKQKQKEEEAGATAPHPPKRVNFSNGLVDSEWLERLAHDPTYQGIDVKRVHGKMQNWCSLRGLTPSRRRLINWLNKEERPMRGAGEPSHKPAYDREVRSPSERELQEARAIAKREVEALRKKFKPSL